MRKDYALVYDNRNQDIHFSLIKKLLISAFMIFINLLFLTKKC